MLSSFLAYLAALEANPVRRFHLAKTIRACGFGRTNHHRNFFENWLENFFYFHFCLPRIIDIDFTGSVPSLTATRSIV